MSVKIIVEVTGPTFDEAYRLLGSLQPAGGDVAATSGAAASSTTKTSTKKTTTTAPATTGGDAKAPAVTHDDVVKLAVTLSGDDAWGASADDRKVKVMNTATHFGVKKFKEIPAERLADAVALLNLLPKQNPKPDTDSFE